MSMIRKIFTTHVPNIEAKDDDGRTPLSWAAGKGHEAVVKYLIDKGAVVHSPDKNGLTPLMWANKNGHQEIAKIIIQPHADVLYNNRLRSFRISWSGYMMVVIDELILDTFFFALQGVQLVRYNNSTSSIALDYIDIRYYDVSFGALSPLVHFAVRSSDNDGSLTLTALEPNGEIYGFCLTSSTMIISSDYESDRQTYYSAVKTNKDRLEWMREITLARTLSDFTASI